MAQVERGQRPQPARYPVPDPQAWAGDAGGRRQDCVQHLQSQPHGKRGRTAQVCLHEKCVLLIACQYE